jgi:NAD(P)-dependent dehydrogenase (short-subunit alcohol dehydrogenase family)
MPPTGSAEPTSFHAGLAIASLAPPFQNQVAVVTGAAGAIGRAIGARLLAGGADVCLVGRTQQSLEQSTSPDCSSADRMHFYPVDLEDEAGVRRLCADVERRHRSIDFLVHCAGALSLDLMRDARVEDFDRQYRVNVRAPFLLTQMLLPQVIDCRGQIVFVNSSAGLHGRKGAGHYSASKHALRGLADSLRDEVNERGVRVLSVFLGRTASRMQVAVHQREGRPYNPGVLLQPDDVAAVVVHALALPRTAEVTDINVRPAQKTY